MAAPVQEAGLVNIYNVQRASGAPVCSQRCRYHHRILLIGNGTDIRADHPTQAVPHQW